MQATGVNQATEVNKDVFEKHKQIVREFTRVFKNQHNIDGVDHLFAPDFKHHFKQPLPPGLEGYKQIGRNMSHAFPDWAVTEEDLMASDDKVIERLSGAGTHRSSLMNEPPTNKKVQWTEMHIYRIKNEKIAEHWVELSMFELFKQIGAIP